jgi:hypothetical protein
MRIRIQNFRSKIRIQGSDIKIIKFYKLKKFIFFILKKCKYIYPLVSADQYQSGFKRIRIEITEICQ